MTENEKNKKAEEFRNKMPTFGNAAVKDLQVQMAGMDERLARQSQALMGIFQKLFQVEQTAKRADQCASVADWRSLAMQKLAIKAGISEEDVVAKVQELQAEQFNLDSASDDTQRGLVNADSESAVEGMFAITTIKMFDGDTLVEERGVSRSKVELGKADLSPEHDAAILEMKVGEVKRYEQKVNNTIYTAELTLLGLRKPAAPVAESTTQNA